MSGKNRKDFAKMAEQNEYIKEAYECLEKMSADERKRREYEERQKILWDHNSFMKSAKIIGVEVHRIKDALHGYFALGIRSLHVQESFEYINHFLEGE